tara:strand:+ start:697 stop:2835 length:2139 start_codon:yes stop_codon:yes gene_type:complete
VKQKVFTILIGKNGNNNLNEKLLELNSSISLIDGVGAVRQKILNEHGIFTINDLLYNFPRRHLDRTTITPIRKIQKGNEVTVVATIETYGQKPIRRGKLFQVIVSDGTGLLTLSWFNGIRYIKNNFKIGCKLAIHGKVDWYNGFTITHPEFEVLDQDEDPMLTGKVIPLYNLTQELKSGGIDQRFFRKVIKSLIASKIKIPELFSAKILKEKQLIPLDKALCQIHFSNNLDDLGAAKRRLKFDEHFFLQLLVAIRKNNIKKLGTKSFFDIGPYFNVVLQTLEFNLTKAQKNVVQEIHSDLKISNPMNRLVQGDVGCGKTIVAILVTALAVGNNVQVAVMAPTEILARQHYESFRKKLDSVKIPCALLVGKQKESERKPILDGLQNGKISVVIGTHALIQKKVIFSNLGLAIIDEQHRFGVNQRNELLKKGKNPHFLSMTATPIPRTLAITYHGDMDLSIIDELPLNRIPVKTKIVDSLRLKKVYSFIRDEVKDGRQCIIVYPLIEESEKSDLKAAVDAYDKLAEEEFSKLKVGLLHGKMDSQDKDDVISKFSQNKINILVSTTVVEVGLDIPNATVMVIEHAERFGLTQLHQLRGRVGRGSEKSYCVLVRREITENSKNRLSIMEKTNNGFDIADQDLKLRGPGDMLGPKQAGFYQYKIANLVFDKVIINEAREVAFDIIEKDPNLENISHKILKDNFMKNYSHHLNDLKLI